MIPKLEIENPATATPSGVIAPHIKPTTLPRRALKWSGVAIIWRVLSGIFMTARTIPRPPLKVDRSSASERPPSAPSSRMIDGIGQPLRGIGAALLARGLSEDRGVVANDQSGDQHRDHRQQNHTDKMDPQTVVRGPVMVLPPAGEHPA